MTNQVIKPEEHIVEQTAIKKGEIKSIFQDKKAWNAPPPKLLKVIGLTIIFSCQGFTAGISTIPGISGFTVKVVAVVTFLISVILGALIKAIGIVYKS